MSLKSEEIAAIDTSVRHQLSKLNDEVTDGRNCLALISLLNLAVVATRSIHALWSESRPRTVLSRNSKAGLEYRREALRFFRTWSDDFPILHTWGVGESDQQRQMLIDLEFGPMKGKALHKTGMRSFIDGAGMAFAEFQHSLAEPRTPIEYVIQQLPPLSFHSRKQWADAIVKWACQRWPDQMKKPGSPLWKLAKPEVELERDKRKGRKRLRALKTKLEKESRGGELDPIAATKIQKKEDYFRGMRVSAAHFRTGLKAQIIGYLERNSPTTKLSP